MLKTDVSNIECSNIENGSNMAVKFTPFFLMFPFDPLENVIITNFFVRLNCDVMHFGNEVFVRIILVCCNNIKMWLSLHVDTCEM